MNLLDRFAAALSPSDAPVLDEVRAYVEWQTGSRAAEFVPSPDDDVDLRTYLLHLRTQGADREQLQTRLAALKRFYAWAGQAGLIPASPFDEYDFDRPFLTREQVRRRTDVVAGEPAARELAHLRALNELAAQLNRAADVRTALDGALQTLLRVLELRTAWVFVLTSSGFKTLFAGETPPHDFAVAASCGLPPGLEQDDRHFLKRPPDCHCQNFFRAGRLDRAVNIVECTRLQNAAAAHGDNDGLLFHASAPLVVQDRLLGILNVATAEWQFLSAADLHLLTSVGAQLAVALDRAGLYDLLHAQRDQMERELQVAHQVQASLLPRELPAIPGFQLAADWRSAHEVAGDFYDIFPLHDGRWGLVVGDVSDKGAPAALYMAMVRSLLRMTAPHVHTPASALRHVNQLLGAQSSYDMFVTIFYAMLDPRTHTLSYANAGHNPPLVRRASGEIEQLGRTGHVVGVFETLKLADAELTLAPGDALVIYTDGVTDALNLSMQDYGMDRLTAAVRAAPPSAPSLLEQVSADLAAFTRTAPQPDDITFFILSRE